MDNDYPVLDFDALSQDAVQSLLKTHQLALRPEEARIIQEQILNRPPTLAECVLWSIQGSEHCSYKSSRTLLKTLPTDAPNVILGPKEDAGVVSVATDHSGKRYGVAMSHESHNHPSQIVPYEGAATGIGGNIRDICCMGAEVIALADGLRFGDLNNPKTHWIYNGVISGIGGYGNPVGVPNVAGDVYFDRGYNDNCLVTVTTLGIVAESDIIHSYAPQNAAGYALILVGKATDNSGFGGASFSSANLAEESHTLNKGAVQEPNAFLKRHLLKANYALFELLQKDSLLDKVGFKDLGAGGIACASVEMAEASGYGAEIQLEHVPLGIEHLPPHVTLCSETQERFMWVVPQDLVETVLTHYNDMFDLPNISHGAGAAVIGRITTDGQYLVKHGSEVLVDVKAEDVTRGIVFDRPIAKPASEHIEPEIKPDSLEAVFLQLLAHENIASRAPIFETYDKQVQGRVYTEAGIADAGVLTPFNEPKYPLEIQSTGIALSTDQNPRFNRIDPYWGAVNAVVEACRNVVATGARPEAITDCLCFGSPENPESMWAFSEAIRGIHDACHAIRLQDYPESPLPVIGGNVSFYNETDTGSIPPSPMISCLGVIPDAGLSVSSSFKQAGSEILMLGTRKDECGGSVYYQLFEELGAKLPKPNLNSLHAEFKAVTSIIHKQYALAVHDISEGGIAVTLAEMAFANEVGFDVNLATDLAIEKALFTETGGFVLEILPEQKRAVTDILQQYQVEHAWIGHTTATPSLQIKDAFTVPLAQAKTLFEHGLREKLL